MAEFPRNYEYLSEQGDLDRVKSWLDDKKYFCTDTETNSLNPFNSELILLQIGNEDKQWIIDTRSVNVQPLRPYMEDAKWTKIGQYLKHDIKMLNKHQGWVLQNVVCTMITEQIIRCGVFARVSMEALCERYLRTAIDKDETLRKSFGNTPVGAFSERQLSYAAGDVIYPIYIARQQKQIAIQRGLGATLSLEREVIPVLALMELNGMKLNTKAWTLLYQEALSQKAIAEKVLNKHFGIVPMVQEGLFGDSEIVRGLDYDSPQKVKKALIRLGYFLEGTDKEDIALAAIQGILPMELAQALLTYRKSFTRSTRYGLDFLKAIENSTGRIHTDFTQAKTTTGRLSSGEDEESDSDKVNLQNIPRDAEYRNCFIPKPGYKYLVYDYQAIEPRILGEISNDPTYLYAFNNNLDIYGVVGTKMLKEEVSKNSGRPNDLREKTKITVLGNSYGTGKDKFYRKMQIDMNLRKGILNKQIVKIERQESDFLWESFFEICPLIKKKLDELSDSADPSKSSRRFYDEVVAMENEPEFRAKVLQNWERLSKFQGGKEIINKLLRHKDYVTCSESMNGRKRFFKAYHRTFWTEGRNHPIQATAADILKTAMVEVDRAIRHNGNDAFIVNQVHDELIIEVRESEAEQVNNYVKPILEQSEAKFLKKVPPKVEGGIKDKWDK